MPARAIALKRVYDPPAHTDGLRVLVERLWPRGLSKDRAKVDLWLKDVAPSHELRRWFGHDPAKWAEFKRRYFAELRTATTGLERLRHARTRSRVTFVFAARDEKHNNAVALRDYMNGVDG